MSKRKNSVNVEIVPHESVVAYTREELAAALIFFADKLDETVDAVFLAAADDEFLTRDYCAKLIEVQGMVQIAAETAALQLTEGILT